MRRSLLIAITLGLVAGAAPPPAVSDAVLADGAREAFAAEEYGRVLSLYEDLRRRHPDSAEIPYNMGIAAYRNGDLARAAELFDDAMRLADDPALRSRSAYNLGTTTFHDAIQGSQASPDAATGLDDATKGLGEALQRFRDALDNDPSDLDARVNGELAQRWLEQLEAMKQQLEDQQQQQQQEQQNRQQQDAGNQDQPEQDRADNQEQATQGREGQEQEQPPEQEQTQEQTQEQGQGQQARPEQEPEQEQEQGAAEAEEHEAVEGEDAEGRVMSREEAERLLQSVRDKEQQRQRERARREAARQPPVDKDW